MKKIYSLMAMLMVSAVGFAQGTMTEENATLSDMGYRLEKDVNWYEGTINGTVFYDPGYEYGSGVDCLSYTDASDNGIKLNNYSINQCINENMEWFYLQLTGNGITCEPGKNGLRSTKNERWIAVSGLRPGQILAIDISNSDEAQFVPNSTACNAKTEWADTMTDPLQVVEITSEVHAIQELAGDGTVDTFRYFKVNEDNTTGWMYAKFNGKSVTSIWRMQIWSSNDDAEAVSAPVYSMKGVDGTARWIRIKPGQSTLNNEVRTYYSVDGSEPLYLEDTDEIDHYDPIIDPETGDTIGQEPVYKKIAKQEGGEWGDYLYDTTLGDEAFVAISESDDEDGDGFVTLKSRSITEGGVFSDVTEATYQVGEIVLNGPSLTLISMNGIERNYKIGWDNNTLCGEEYTLVAEIDGGGSNPVAVGDVILATKSVKVTVEAAGYTTGETEIEVLNPDVEYFVKEDGKYNWDFTTFTDEQLEKINQTYVTGGIYYPDPEDSTKVITYTREEFLLGETEAGEEIPDAAEALYGSFGWDQLDSRMAGRHWRVMLTDTLTTTSSEGTDSVYYTFSFGEDHVGLFHDGLVLDCPMAGTYPDNWSAMAIFDNGNGLYCVTKPTFTIPEVKYGEYVAYSTNKTAACEPAQDNWDGETTTYGFTKTLDKESYIYTIAVYTTENLPDNIAAPMNNAEFQKINAIYNLAGQQVARDYKGVVIKNGKKYLQK